MQKTLLLSTAVIIGFGVCSLFLWKARSEQAADSEARSANAPAAPTGPTDPIDALSAESSPGSTSKSDVATQARAAATPKGHPQVELTSDLAGMADMASDATAASLNEGRFPENHLFAEKYASSSASERRDARDAIEALLLAHKLGTEDKGQALTDQQVVELGHEIEWLQANANP